MSGTKNDHRVRLTRQIIKASLIDLMRDYPISKVSVKMLCEAAGINRSTFYAHYTGTYDLLGQIQQEIIAEVSVYVSQSAFAEQSELTVEAVHNILEYAKKNSEMFKVLLSENGDYTFQRDVMALAQQKTISAIRSNKEVDKRTSEYLQLFVVTGALSVIQKWLRDGMRETTHEMAELCTKLLFKGVSDFY